MSERSRFFTPINPCSRPQSDPVQTGSFVLEETADARRTTVGPGHENVVPGAVLGFVRFKRKIRSFAGHHETRVKTHKSQKPLSPSRFRLPGLWNGSEKNESDQQVTFYESGP